MEEIDDEYEEKPKRREAKNEKQKVTRIYLNRIKVKNEEVPDRRRQRRGR